MLEAPLGGASSTSRIALSTSPIALSTVRLCLVDVPGHPHKPRRVFTIRENVRLSTSFDTESRVRGLPDWLLVGGLVLTACCLAAVVVAFFLRRSDDVSRARRGHG